MTDTYTKLREYFTKYPEGLMSRAVGRGEARIILQQIMKLYPKTYSTYVRTDTFTEQDWNNIKQVCDVLDSPLMKALS